MTTTATGEKGRAGAAAQDTRVNVPPQLLHDLRGPLDQIIGYSEMLTEVADADQHPQSVTDLARIGSAGRRILALLDEHFVTSNEVAPRTATVDDRQVEAPVAAQETVLPGELLVVDDDGANRDVLSRRLVRQGHRVTTAASGRDALRLMGETAFDVVLLDIMMPDMDGYELLGLMKADSRLAHIPVIMVSALSELQSVVRCIEAGAEDYLTKPFNPVLLRARIGASLEKKRGRDRETALYERLQENYGRLQEVEKLRDDMRNMIVHDLRTPLSAMLAGIQMLELHGDLSAMQRELMTIASGGGRTLLGMINDLLDVEKMESGTMQLDYEPLSAATLVSDALAQVAALAEMEMTTLVAEVPDALPAFSGDANKLSRTLVNLIANAIKFTRRGTVTVSVSSDSQHVRFSVRDTGAGIPEEAFARIFEKFGQLDARNKVGTGLGLAFCKLAVEAHHGTISVESTVGAGSTFAFTVPAPSLPSLPSSTHLPPGTRHPAR